MVLYKELRLWKQMWQLKDGMFRDQLPLKVLNFLLRPWFSRRKIWFFFDKIYKGGDSSEYLYRYSGSSETESINIIFWIPPARTIAGFRRKGCIP